MKQIKIEKEIRAKDLTEKLKQEAQMRFVKWVAKERDIDYYAALMICHGQTDPPDYEITLGYKMSNPIYMIAMNLQRKPNREMAIKNFRDTLLPEEREIFDEHVLTEGMRTNFKKKLKNEVRK